MYSWQKEKWKKDSGWQTQADQRWRPPGTGGARMWANKSVSCSNVEAPQRLKLLLWGLQCELIKPGGALGDPNLLTEPLLCLLLYVVRPISQTVRVFKLLILCFNTEYVCTMWNCPCSVVHWTIGHVVSSWLPYSTDFIFVFVSWVGGGEPSQGCTKMFEASLRLGKASWGRFFRKISMSCI